MASSRWGRRLARLKRMRSEELFDRLRQHVSARGDALRFQAANNFSAVPHADSGSACGRFYFNAAELPELLRTLKQVFPAQAREIVLQAEKICRHRFDLLGYTDLDLGAEIDWHTDVVHAKKAPRKPWFKIKYLDFEEVGDSKITWELNRHQHFVTLAKAYRLSGDDRFAREIFDQWNHWHEQNPYPIGLNWASSLEVGFRSLSWLWTFFLLEGSALLTAELRRQWLAALRLNGRHIETYLSTYFSPNTHLLGEALALFSIGLLVPGARSAAQSQRGWRILEGEAGKQVRQDGFYFEQSMHYHVYALDMFLHARILAALNALAISERFDRILQQMSDALLLLGRAGVPHEFGDDDGGRLFDPTRNRAEHMLDPLATSAVLYRRGDFKFTAGTLREETLWLLGLEGLAEFDSLAPFEPSPESVTLPDSGIYLMAEPESAAQLMIDAGPLGSGQGGHGHADALGITLIQKGRSLLIDPGTFEYVGVSGARARFRGTAAHNTLQIDGRDQAESSGPFSWQNMPRVSVERWIAGHAFELFQGSHDGYSRLPFPVIHRRWVFHRKGSFWFVRDLAEGAGQHELGLRWHLDPALVALDSSGTAFGDDRVRLNLLTAENHGWSQAIGEDDWSPVYGQRERASVVKFGTTRELPAEFATLLIADEGVRSDFGLLTKLHGSVPRSVSAYLYSKAQEEHRLFFAMQPGPWSAGIWGSDADFLYWFHDRKAEKSVLVLCNGSYADAAGRRILTCGRQVGYAEVLTAGAKVDSFSSDPGEVVLHQALDRVGEEGAVAFPDKDSNGMGV